MRKAWKVLFTHGWVFPTCLGITELEQSDRIIGFKKKQPRDWTWALHMLGKHSVTEQTFSVSLRLFWNRISLGWPGWPWLQFVDKAALDLWIFLSQPPEFLRSMPSGSTQKVVFLEGPMVSMNILVFGPWDVCWLVVRLGPRPVIIGLCWRRGATGLSQMTFTLLHFKEYNAL